MAEPSVALVAFFVPLRVLSSVPIGNPKLLSSDACRTDLESVLILNRLETLSYSAFPMKLAPEFEGVG